MINWWCKWEREILDQNAAELFRLANRLVQYPGIAEVFKDSVPGDAFCELRKHVSDIKKLRRARERFERPWKYKRWKP